MKNICLSITIVLGMFMMFHLAPTVKAEEPSAQVATAIKMLKDSTAKLGAPIAADGTLSFGGTKMNDNFDIVDAVKAAHNCTATLFVKNGDNFVRVTTNVMAEGKRAVGTVLDVRGPAYKAISKGKSFAGVVDVVGTKMDTGYEPITDAAGAVIGIYYVGFKL